MSEVQNEDVIEMPDELSSLKARADMLGLSYHPSIGLDKLRDKVSAAIAGYKDEPEVAPVVATETAQAVKARQRNEALELVRIRVSCMNPNKKEWEGEIFSIGNSLIGTQKKFVPFNNEEGWHVPRCIYDMITGRECQIFVSYKDARGGTIRKGKLIKEFAVEVLPPLTGEELEELARRQAMSKAVD